jgi:imidazolonepropionase
VAALITNIGELVTNSPGESAAGPAPLAAITDAALVIEDGRVAWVGPAGRAPAADT